MERRRPSDRSNAAGPEPGSDSRTDGSTSSNSGVDAGPNSDRRPDPDATPGRDDRGLLRSLLTGLVNLFVVLVLFGGLLLGALWLSPVALEELEDLEGIDDLEDVDVESAPDPSSDPPPAGEREPDAMDPDDPGESTYETDVETIASEDVEDFVHAEVNDRRADHDLEPIEWDGTVASVSRAHSHDMAEQEYFAHTNQDGEDPYDRFADVDDYCQAYGENIALTWADRPVEQPGGDEVIEHQTAEGLATGLVDQWMNSTEHREAILEEHASHGWDRGGVGVYVDDDGAVYASHNFCLPW